MAMLWASVERRETLETLDIPEHQAHKERGETQDLMDPMEHLDPLDLLAHLDRLWTASMNCIPCKTRRKPDPHSDLISFKLKWAPWDHEDLLDHLEILAAKVCLV